jgi:hypothetical protein
MDWMGNARGWNSSATNRATPKRLTALFFAIDDFHTFLQKLGSGPVQDAVAEIPQRLAIRFHGVAVAAADVCAFLCPFDTRKRGKDAGRRFVKIVPRGFEGIFSQPLSESNAAA